MANKKESNEMTALEDHTVEELKAIAEKEGVETGSHDTKAEIIEAIEEARGEEPEEAAAADRPRTAIFPEGPEPPK